MKLKIGIFILLLLGLVFVFWPGHPPNQFLMSLISGSPKQITGTTKQKQIFNTLPPLVKAEFAKDVTEEDKSFIIQGISSMDFYLNKWFGKSINSESGLRVDTTPDDTPGRGAKVEFENGKMVILVGTKAWIWKQQTQLNAVMGGDSHPHVSSHEYVHVYQYQNGCGNSATHVHIAPKWFEEGEAEWLSYKVTQETGWTPTFSISQMLVTPAKGEPSTLKSHEVDSELTPSSYSMYAMAIDFLMKDRPIKALDDFCANLAGGKGMSMPKAFEKAFGITLEKFYEDFENSRKTWSSDSPIQPSQNQGQGQIPQQYCSSFAMVPNCSFVGASDSQNYKYCKQCYPNK